MKKLLALFCLAIPVCAQQINPTTQIQWNRLTGIGSPASNGFVCTSNSIGTATTAIQGEMYTDQAGPHYWTCAKPSGTPTWFQVDNPGNATVIQVNGDPTSPVSPVDFNDTTPAADPGYINAKVRKTGASVSVEIPSSLPASIQPAIVPPVAGQYVILRPHTVTTSGQVYNVDTNGGTLAVGPICSLSQNSTITWSGYSLADYGIDPANVTAVYAGSTNGLYGTDDNPACWFSYAPYVYGSNSITTAGTNLNAGSTPPWTMGQATALTSLTGTDIATATTTASITLSSQTALRTWVNVSDVFLIVYYTGSAVTTPDYLNIASPLNYNYESNTLGLDPNFPYYILASTVATLPNADNAYPQVRAVSDGATATDCTTGGGTYYVVCARQPSAFPHYAWVALTGGGGGSGTVTNVGSGAGLTGGPITNTGTLSIDFSRVNTWTGKQTQPAPLFSDLAGGGTQCLQVDNTGQVSGTTCGGGGGSVGGSGTAGWYALWSASATLGNGNIDDGITAAGFITFHEPQQIVCSGCSTQTDWTYNAGHAPTPGSSTTASFAPDASGNATISEAGAAYSRVCTAANGVCSGSGSLTSINSQTGPAVTLQSSGATVTITNPSSNVINLEAAAAPSSSVVDILSLDKPTGTTKMAPPIEQVSVANGATQNLINITDAGYIDSLSFQTSGSSAGTATSSTINIYYNGEGSPTVSVTVGNFCMAKYIDTANVTSFFGSEFILANSTKSSDAFSCAFMLPIPFATGIKIDYVNNTGSTVTMWAQVEYQSGVADTWPNTRKLRILQSNPGTVSAYTQNQIASYAGGPGRMIGIWWLEDSTAGGASPLTGPIEGNFRYYQDSAATKTWAASTAYSLGDKIIDSRGNLQTVTTGGTSGSSQPTWNYLSSTTSDGTVTWTESPGNPSNTWKASKPYSLAGSFSILDTNGNIQVLSTAGTSAASAPTWTTTPGGTTTDGTAVWTNVGSSYTAAATTSTGSEDMFGIGHYFGGAGVTPYAGNTGATNSVQIPAGIGLNPYRGLTFIGATNGATQAAYRWFVRDKRVFTNGFSWLWQNGDSSQSAFTGSGYLNATVFFYTQN